jgi:transposase
VRRQKNGAIDAEAICEAAQRPSMRFVAVKSESAVEALGAICWLSATTLAASGARRAARLTMSKRSVDFHR